MATLEEFVEKSPTPATQGARHWVPMDRESKADPHPGTPLQLATASLLQAEAQTERLVQELAERLERGGVLYNVPLDEPEQPELPVPSSPLLTMLATRTATHAWLSLVLRRLLAQVVV